MHFCAPYKLVDELRVLLSSVSGIPGALTAVSAVQQLCILLKSRVELVRSGASLALGYLSFDQEARRRLLNWYAKRLHCCPHTSFRLKTNNYALFSRAPFADYR